MKNQNRRQFLKSGSGLVAGLTITGAGCTSIAHEQKLDYFFDIVKLRRSVRQFKSNPVPEKDIRQILEYAKLCPSAGNRQPWKFVVMQDKDRAQKMRDIIVKNRLRNEIGDKTLPDVERTELRQRINAGLDGYFSAPVYIGVLTDNEARFARTMNKHDGPIVASYICLVARAMGYGSLYVTGSIPAPAFRYAADVPDRYAITCVVLLGIPVAWPDMPEKKVLDDLIVWDGF